MGQVTTVLGPVPAEQLGITLMHEHILIDFDWPGFWPAASARPELLDRPVSIELLGLLKRDPFLVRDNGRLDDVGLAAREVSEFKASGGQTIVEVTSIGIGRQPLGLRSISQATGVHIVAGCGWYVGPSHPAYLEEDTLGQLTRRIVADLSEGMDGTDVRAGVIGEIGTFNPIRPTEEKSLRAAARAHLETGAGLSIHLSSREGGNVRQVVAILGQEGVDPSRVALGHIELGISQEDRYFALDKGFNVEFDTLGHEHYYSLHPGAYAYIWRDPRDIERMAWIQDLIERGYVNQILLSQDVFGKTCLKRFGGWGYDHILVNIVPLLKAHFGVSDEMIETMLVKNPARVLAG